MYSAKVSLISTLLLCGFVYHYAALSLNPVIIVIIVIIIAIIVIIIKVSKLEYITVWALGVSGLSLMRHVSDSYRDLPSHCPSVYSSATDAP